MFPVGSDVMYPHTRRLLEVVVQAIAELPNHLSVRGHTDSLPWKGGGANNWSLSAGRAEATRQALLRDGIGEARFRKIEGVADREPLVPNDPENARNRRISIILLKQSIAPATPRADKKPPATKAAPKKDEPANRRREEGVIYFP